MLFFTMLFYRIMSYNSRLMMKNGKKRFDIPIYGALIMPRIAEIDRAILAQLRKNGRMSFVDLAKEVGASERTVRTHIRAMEENGTIRGYTVRESGIGLTALIRIKVSPGVEIGSFASEVTGWEGVEIIYEVSGEADLVALVHVDDTVALRSLLDKMWMAADNEIASTTTELVLEQY
jgi:DNA-binding Lrp family transcriptional regulator